MEPFNDGVNPVGEIKDGHGKLVQGGQFGKLHLVVWGGLRPGGVVTVHIPSRIVRHGATHGGLPACMPAAGAYCLWTYEFGYTTWEGAVLCKRCFNKDGTPRARYKPTGGWWAYSSYPLIEKIANLAPTPLDKKTEAARFMLSMEAKSYDDGDLAPQDSRKRVVEV